MGERNHPPPSGTLDRHDRTRGGGEAIIAMTVFSGEDGKGEKERDASRGTHGKMQVPSFGRQRRRDVLTK